MRLLWERALRRVIFEDYKRKRMKDILLFCKNIMICGAVVSWMVSMEQRLHLSVAEERALYIEVTYKYIMKLKKYFFNFFFVTKCTLNRLYI